MNTRRHHPISVQQASQESRFLHFTTIHPFRLAGSLPGPIISRVPGAKPLLSVTEILQTSPSSRIMNTMDFATIIKEIGRGAKGARAMSREQAQTLLTAILDGTVPDMELGAILMALRIKGETPEELAGFKAALDARTRQVAVPEGPRCVILPSYSGARKQANLMPLLALLLAQRGIPVLIHGRHDTDSRSNTFKLLEALDIPPQTSLPNASAEK